ncbi:uncharacterized protein [Mytilus edulis]|uniref:uncharacterized protein isoform X4 n=1 Tax=Mytilus edulis TaxID=6550 RepID=UPI0039EF1103
MARGICILLLVVVAAVSTSGYGSYRSYDTAVYSGYPIHTTSSVVTHHSSHHSYHGVSYYKRYHGFKIRHRRFSYHGLGYKLRCGKSRFYRLWRRCYGKYHSRSRCFGVFRTRHLFGLYKGHGYGYGGGYLSYYKKYHGFKLRHNRFFYGGLGYKLRCARRRFYRSWRSCYIRYHSRSRCFGYLRKRHLFGIYKGHGYGGGYLSYYRKYHGFKLRHNRFFYGGHGYKLRCARRRFYRSWRSCYRRYHSRSRCFGYLRKRHLFGIYHRGYSGHVYNGYRSVRSHTKYSYSYYRSHHGFSIRHSRFSYHGVSYRLKCSSTRFYRLWSNCYDHYHSVGTCFGRLRRQHLFYRYVGGSSYGGIFGGHSVTKYSYSYYRSHHGFSIRHNRFSYHGVSYRLKCSSTRFYRLWSNCYDHYHSVGTCFGRLRSQHLFYRYVGGSSYGGIFGRHSVTKYSYSYYRSHHGFSIRHKRFSYHGVSYRLKCSSTRFYRLWSNCYDHYHSVGTCFGRLRSQHLFYRYVGGSSYGGIFGRHSVTKYSYSYYRSHHGFSIRHNRFSYHGVSYRLKCSSTRFYRLWSNCYDHYHSVGTCFGRLRSQHLFYRYVGGSSYGGIFGRHSVTKYSYSYYRSHHGFSIRHNRFSYHGVSYRLKCSSTRFYRLWSNCYDHYHSVGTCFGRLRSQHLFYRYVGGSSYGGIFGGHSVTKYSYSYYRSHHGFSIRHNRFSYHGVSYRLKCSSTRFYRLWSNCYDHYHSVGTCFGRLRSQHLFYRYVGGSSYGGIIGGYGHSRYSYSYYRSHHGFSIRHKRFSYHGVSYRLKCSSTRFYRLWSNCYDHYHSVGTCFGRLRRQHLFYRYVGGSSYGGIVGGYGHGRYSYSYYRNHHGFSIRHNRFIYHGVSYQLKCSSSRFYRLWSDCYDDYHSVGDCFGLLRRQHLFYKYVAVQHAIGLNLLRKHSHIANHHVNAINNVANKHVARISHVSKKHERNIANQAGKHVHKIASVANKHINRFKALVDFHIKRLHKHTKQHLSALEYQHKRHLHDREYQNKKHELKVNYLHGKHEHTINKLHDYHGIYGVGHLVSYLDYYKKYHGFKISHNRFLYGGKAYTLKCGLQRFYNLWSNCWSSYHRRSLCFGRLRKSHLFELYSGDYDNDYAPGAVVVKKTVYSGGYHLGDSHVVTYMDYYKKYHGFKISHSRFTYGGKAYTLKCGLQRFYNVWSDCWSSYHSRSACFGRLLNQHLFSVYHGDYDVGYSPKTVVVKTASYDDDLY